MEMASRLSEGGIDDGIFDNHLAHIGKIPYSEDLRTQLEPVWENWTVT